MSEHGIKLKGSSSRTQLLNLCLSKTPLKPFGSCSLILVLYPFSYFSRTLCVVHSSVDTTPVNFELRWTFELLYHIFFRSLTIVVNNQLPWGPPTMRDRECRTEWVSVKGSKSLSEVRFSTSVTSTFIRSFTTLSALRPSRRCLSRCCCSGHHR